MTKRKILKAGRGKKKTYRGTKNESRLLIRKYTN